MYPSRINSHSTQVAVVTLPDGRKVRAQETGYHEGDTGAWVETSDVELTWEDDESVGEELTDEEINAPAYAGEKNSLTVFQYVCKFADWKAE